MNYIQTNYQEMHGQGLSRWYQPDPDTDALRKKLDKGMIGKELMNWVETETSIQMSELDLSVPNGNPIAGMVCFGYALFKLTGDPDSRFQYDLNNLTKLSESVSNIYKKQFTPTLNPKKGDLALYYRHNKPEPVPILEHAGIVLAEDLVESKWGSIPAIFIHKTFEVPESWGDEVRYYTFTT